MNHPKQILIEHKEIQLLITKRTNLLINLNRLTIFILNKILLALTFNFSKKLFIILCMQKIMWNQKSKHFFLYKIFLILLNFYFDEGITISWIFKLELRNQFRVLTWKASFLLYFIWWWKKIETQFNYVNKIEKFGIRDFLEIKNDYVCNVCAKKSIKIKTNLLFYLSMRWLLICTV